MQEKARYRYVAAFLLAMAIAHGFEFWQQRARMTAGYGDFSAFYTAGMLLHRGEGKSLYDPRVQWTTQQEFAQNVGIREGPMPYIRPPFEALLFFPLAYFSYPVALALWSAVKLVFLWLTMRVLPRVSPFARMYPPGLEVILCLGIFPVFLDFLQGQDAILLLFIVTMALNRLRIGQDFLAGCVLALGLFKFHLVIPIVIMLWLAGRSRVLLGFLPVAGALVAVSCLISGVGVLFSYPSYLLTLNRTVGAGFVTVGSMPNLRGALSSLVGHAPHPNFSSMPLLLLAVAVLAMIGAARVWKPGISRGFTGLALGYSLALIIAILTSYYAYSYDMTLLLVPVLLLGGTFLDQPSFDKAGLTLWQKQLIGGGLLLLICSPIYWALILQLDRPYLLVAPMLILLVGIVGVMRRSSPAFG